MTTLMLIEAKYHRYKMWVMASLSGENLPLTSEHLRYNEEHGSNAGKVSSVGSNRIGLVINIRFGAVNLQ